MRDKKMLEENPQRASQKQKAVRATVATDSTRKAYLARYYQEHKTDIETRRSVRNQRKPKMCISCHNPFTPLYARQTLCTVCAAALNARCLPADASAADVQTFHAVSRINPAERKQLSAGFIKKKHMIESLLRATIARYEAEVEAASWQEQYFNYVAKYARSTKRDAAVHSENAAADKLTEASKKLFNAQRNLEVHLIIRDDGKFFNVSDGSVVHSAPSGDVADMSAEECYQKLLADMLTDDML